LVFSIFPANGDRWLDSLGVTVSADVLVLQKVGYVTNGLTQSLTAAHSKNQWLKIWRWFLMQDLPLKIPHHLLACRCNITNRSQPVKLFRSDDS